MTQQKKLKKAIRARARKTGESYTAARHQLLTARKAPVAPSRPAPRPLPAAAKGAVSAAAVLRKTGRDLDHWFAVLDAFAGKTKGHTAAAGHLYSAHGVDGWYAQGITVAWERARGLRAMNQSSTGKFQVSVSRTVPASVREVVALLSSAQRRRSWLAAADGSLRRALQAAFTGAKPRAVTVKNDGYARMRYPWEGGTVELHLYGKPTGCSVVASNTNLSEPALVEARRAQWRDALDALKRNLKA